MVGTSVIVSISPDMDVINLPKSYCPKNDSYTSLLPSTDTVIISVKPLMLSENWTQSKSAPSNAAFIASPTWVTPKTYSYTNNHVQDAGWRKQKLNIYFSALMFWYKLYLPLADCLCRRSSQIPSLVIPNQGYKHTPGCLPVVRG